MSPDDGLFSPVLGRVETTPTGAPTRADDGTWRLTVDPGLARQLLETFHGPHGARLIAELAAELGVPQDRVLALAAQQDAGAPAAARTDFGDLDQLEPTVPRLRLVSANDASDDDLRGAHTAVTRPALGFSLGHRAVAA